MSSTNPRQGTNQLFSFRCPRCSAEITFKTDPKNTDYVAEHGASRNFEPWRTKDDDENKEFEEEEVADDPMKALENRTLDSKREMEILDALDEIRLRNARSERVNLDEVLKRFSAADRDAIQSRLKEEEQEDERKALEAFQSADGERVRKLTNDEEPDAITLVNQAAELKPQSSAFKALNLKRKQEEDRGLLGVAIKRKKTQDDNAKPKQDTPSNGLALSMLASYDDSEDSDSSS